MFPSQNLILVALGLLVFQPVLGRPVLEKGDTKLDVHAHAVKVDLQQDTSTTSTTTITTYVTRTTYVSAIATSTSTITTAPPPPPRILPTQRRSLHNGQLAIKTPRQIHIIETGSRRPPPPRQPPRRSTASRPIPRPTSPTSPQPSPPSQISFTIPQLQNSHQSRNPLLALAHAYSKFSIPHPPNLKKALLLNPNRPVFRVPISPSNSKPFYPSSKRSLNKTGSVLAVPPNGFDQEYISPIKIGTPPQTVFLALDTGSSDLWTLSSLTPGALLTPLHTLYHPQNSSSAIHLPSQTWRVLYGDGSAAQGTTYLDSVSLGGSNLTVPNQSIGVATLISPHFNADPFLSGILGLGFSHKNKANSPPTFFENIKPQLKEPLFTSDIRAGFPGRFTFGEIDHSAYTGKIDYTKIDPNSPYWLFNVTASQVSSNGTKIEYLGGGLKTIADTGTSLILLPRVMVEEYYSAIPGSGYDRSRGGMVVPCRMGRSWPRELPDWNFWVKSGEGEGEEYKGVVPGRYINFGPVNGTHCFGGIQHADGFGFAVFGDVLLKSQFVVWDVGGGRIGFAGKRLRT
ncbi:aspartic peptidase domain-containing protein [Podospora fimiseda]|uniref:Aspartic peptidase domain-containing protein n=1 Tax=Podospora fimiseda TaxID=252190 RepID=A0AAN7BXS4_9PEZI|nr:aspartic peptidase domain-containing protein [Podospora fimiseda]